MSKVSSSKQFSAISSASYIRMSDEQNRELAAKIAFGFDIPESRLSDSRAAIDRLTQ